MITDDEVLTLFEQADPAGTDDIDDTRDATGYLTALQSRSIDVTNNPSPSASNRPTSNRWLWVGAAAAAVLIVVALTVAIGDRDGTDDLIPAGQPTTVDSAAVPSADATIPPPTDPAAQPVIDYLAAYALGDPERVAAMETDDFVLRFAYFDGGLITPSDESFLSGLHQAASGVVYAEPRCEIEEVGAIETVVACTARLRLAAHQAVNSAGVPANLTIVLTPDGVRRFDTFHELGLVSFLQAFDEFAAVNCPELLDDPSTAAERVASGRLEAECAAQWSDFGVQTARDVFSDLDAGEVDSFLGRFVANTAVLGVPADEAPATFSSFTESGSRIEVSRCVTDGVVSLDIQVVCEAELVEADGSRASESVTMSVAADGVITTNRTTIELPG